MRDLGLYLPEPVVAAVLRHIEGTPLPEDRQLVDIAHQRLGAALLRSIMEESAAEAFGEEPGLAPPGSGAP